MSRKAVKSAQWLNCSLDWIWHFNSLVNKQLDDPAKSCGTSVTVLDKVADAKFLAYKLCINKYIKL